jgi:hypothetical protein
MAEPTVTLSASLYDAQAVEATAGAYRALARIVVERAGDELHVTFHDADPALPDLVDEFLNHALHETIVRARESARQGA